MRSDRLGAIVARHLEYYDEHPRTNPEKHQRRLYHDHNTTQHRDPLPEPDLEISHFTDSGRISKRIIRFPPKHYEEQEAYNAA